MFNLTFNFSFHVNEFTSISNTILFSVSKSFKERVVLKGFVKLLNRQGSEVISVENQLVESPDLSLLGLRDVALGCLTLSNLNNCLFTMLLL